MPKLYTSSISQKRLHGDGDGPMGLNEIFVLNWQSKIRSRRAPLDGQEKNRREEGGKLEEEPTAGSGMWDVAGLSF